MANNSVKKCKFHYKRSLNVYRSVLREKKNYIKLYGDAGSLSSEFTRDIKIYRKDLANTPQAICTRCGGCKRCCTNYSCPAPKRKEKQKWPTIDLPIFKKGKVNNLPRALGIEIEASEWGDFWESSVVAKYGGRDYDGSVLPSKSEYCLFPFIGDDYVKKVKLVSKLLAKNKAQVNSTCGFHVHVNARDYDYNSLRKLLKLWRTIEYEVYTWLVGLERADSRFCIPYWKTAGNNTHGYSTAIKKIVDDPVNYNAIDDIWETKNYHDIRRKIHEWVYSLKIVPKKSKNKSNYLKFIGHLAAKYRSIGNTELLTSEGRSIYNIKKDKQQTARYYGLNIHSWFYRGTVEFRMFPGTVDMDDMIYWPLFCGWLVEFADKMKDSEIDRIKGLVKGDIINRMPEDVVGWLRARWLKVKNKKHLLPVYEGRVLRDEIRHDEDRNMDNDNDDDWGPDENGDGLVRRVRHGLNYGMRLTRLDENLGFREQIENADQNFDPIDIDAINRVREANRLTEAEIARVREANRLTIGEGLI